jgi:NAD(P)-dependent dehydrogenase (short-subunit alcohol dehydrogenase family)
LKGRVALITGGATPLGRVLAETFAELGAAVALLDRPDAGAEDVARGVTDTHGVLTTVVPVDPADEAAVRKAPQRVVDTCGRLDILVLNAAEETVAAKARVVEDQTLGTWRSILEARLTAPFLLAQQAVPALRASGKGSLIVVGNLHGAIGPDWRVFEDGEGTSIAEAAAGGGLLQMTRWLATTLAPQVRVNAIVPGVGDRGAAARRRYAARTPLARVATEEDIKGAAAFLASDLSAFMTGQCLTIDGGWSAW